jgi:endonuclease/exonuclease/phosphatase (EEP) superfamily protein YafD
MKRPTMTALSKHILADVTIIFGVLSIAGSFDQLSNLTYIAACFRFQYLIALVICLVCAAMMRVWALVFASVGLIALNAFYVAPYVVPSIRPQNVVVEPSSRLRICQINVNSRNLQYDRVIAYIKATNADVVLVEELTEPFAKEIGQKLPQYNYVKTVPRPDPFGLGTYSRLPLSRSEIKYFARSTFPTIVSDVTLKDASQITLIHVHAVPSLSSKFFKSHIAQISEIAAEAHTSTNPVVAAGDFNATMWNGSMQRFVTDGKLRSAAVGCGWLPTWPKELWQWGYNTVIETPLAMISIDHCIVDAKLRVDHFKVGEDVGSDHLPICVEVSAERN